MSARRSLGKTLKDLVRPTSDDAGLAGSVFAALSVWLPFRAEASQVAASVTLYDLSRRVKGKRVRVLPFEARSPPIQMT